MKQVTYCTVVPMKTIDFKSTPAHNCTNFCLVCFRVTFVLRKELGALTREANVAHLRKSPLRDWLVRGCRRRVDKIERGEKTVDLHMQRQPLSELTKTGFWFQVRC